MDIKHVCQILVFIMVVISAWISILDNVRGELSQARLLSETNSEGSLWYIRHTYFGSYISKNPWDNLPEYQYRYFQREFLKDYNPSEKYIGGRELIINEEAINLLELSFQNGRDSESGGNHDPIFIFNNEDFTTENGVTGGSGTSEDPYILDGWIIIGNGSTQTGIFISNTTAAFVIRDCSISNFSGEVFTGISLNNVTSGRIEGVEVFKNYKGIEIIKSSFICVENCVCRDNYGTYATGIFVLHSHHIIITDCKCYRMIAMPSQNWAIGIILDGSWDCQIKNSTCYSNSACSIYFDMWEREYPLQNNTIDNCIIYQNKYFGIIFQMQDVPGENINKIYPGYNRISNCEIYDSGISVTLFLIDHTIIDNCIFYRNDCSMYIFESSNNIIHNCSFYNQDVGIILMDQNVPGLYSHTADNIIEHCDIFDLGAGIESYEARRTIICHNNIFNCTYHALFGIALRFTTARVYGNNIYDNNISYFYRGSIFDARNNWWGSPLGPSRFLSLRGDSIWTRFGSICLCFPWAMKPYADAGVMYKG